ncbi:MAG: Uma2 family endonuclease [Pirellulales bacterium]
MIRIVPKDTFQDRPKIIVEVSSPSTRRTDEGEKLEAYLTIPTLHAYLLVDSTQRFVVVHQRSGQEFVRTVFVEDVDVVRFANPEVELTLAEIYADVVFPPPEADEQ